MRDIVVYSKSLCPACDDLKKALTDEELEFDVIDVIRDEAARDEVIDAGFRSLPVVKYKGEFVKDVMEVFE